MRLQKYKFQQGSASSVLLILGVVVVVIIVVVFAVSRFVAVRRAPADPAPPDDQTQAPPELVYETQLGDVKFIFSSAQDLGNILLGASAPYNRYFTPKDLTTTERFVRVVVGAQDKGKFNVTQSSWGLGNIVDSEGRNYIPIDSQARPWLPTPDLCGTILKPEFEPVPCVKIYEVSTEAEDLKIEVKVTSPKKESGYLDLDFDY